MTKKIEQHAGHPAKHQKESSFDSPAEVNKFPTREKKSRLESSLDFLESKNKKLQQLHLLKALKRKAAMKAKPKLRKQREAEDKARAKAVEKSDGYGGPEPIRTNHLKVQSQVARCRENLITKARTNQQISDRER